MKKPLRTYTYTERDCPACGGSEAELIKTISKARQGMKYEHYLEAHLCVCKECGFLFANPAVTQEELAEYYGDMLSVYESESSYSVAKRLELITRYAREGGIIAEIGANEQGVFKEQLENRFDQYVSVDINSSYNNSYDTIKSLKSGIDMLVSYCVLEHIRDLEGFLSDCYARVKPEGVYIIEVPDAAKYYKEAHPLELAEHLNHFIPESLTRLMCRAGFELLEISRTHASRDCTFAGVYKKKRIRQETSPAAPFDYVIGKSLLVEGIATIEHNRERFRSTVCRLHEMMENGGNRTGTVFWCANEMLRKVIDHFLEVYGTFDALIIDEDVRKKAFYLDYSAKTSKEVWESGKLAMAEVLIICSDCRVESITKTLKERYTKCYEALLIYFIDEEWNLHLYQKQGPEQLQEEFRRTAKNKCIYRNGEET